MSASGSGLSPCQVLTPAPLQSMPPSMLRRMPRNLVVSEKRMLSVAVPFQSHDRLKGVAATVRDVAADCRP